ncbi:MAG: hypothetical protein WCB02_19075 [Bradyrhizobium sp.]
MSRSTIKVSMLAIQIRIAVPVGGSRRTDDAAEIRLLRKTTLPAR